MSHWPVWLFCISLALRGLSIGASMLWYDETLTAYFAQLPLPTMMKAIAGDVHPPLWYLIEWGVVHVFGHSEIALRAPAALFGAGAVVTLYALVNQLAGEGAARWSSSLMAVMPGQLYYSQEARMYSLLTLLVLLGMLAILNRQWLTVALCCALILFTQNIGAVYVGLLGGWSLIASRGRALKWLALAGASYLPQLPTTIAQLQHVGGSFWIPNPDNFGGALYYINFTTAFVRLPVWLQVSGLIASLGTTITSIVVLRADIRKLLPLAALAFGPGLLLYIASVVWKPVLLERALLPSGAALVGLWGIAASRLPEWARKPAAAIGLPILLAGLVTYYIDPVNQRPRSDPAISIISEAWQPGDVVYHMQMDSMMIQDYYLPGKPAFLFPESGDLRQSLSNDTKTFAGISERQAPPDQLGGMGYKRLWLMGGWSVLSSKYEIDNQQAIIAHYPIIRQYDITETKLYRITLYLLRLI